MAFNKPQKWFEVDTPRRMVVQYTFYYTIQTTDFKALYD